MLLTYIGLDVHKDSISVAIAETGRQAPEFRGEIPNEPRAIDTLVDQLSQRYDGQPLLFSYEAGPCGYGVYHQIQARKTRIIEQRAEKTSPTVQAKGKPHGSRTTA